MISDEQFSTHSTSMFMHPVLALKPAVYFLYVIKYKIQIEVLLLFICFQNETNSRFRNVKYLIATANSTHQIFIFSLTL